MEKLHLGCGPNRFDGWINIDIDSPVADLLMDLRDRLPYPDGGIEYVYFEHFLEHLGRADAVRMLAECRRVLSPGGTLRLSTPSLEHLAIVYLRRDIAGWGADWKPRSPCLMVNEGMRSWGHQHLYDAEDLRAVLLEAGFAAVTFVPWRQSSVPALAGLESREFHNDLIVEALLSPAGAAELDARADGQKAQESEGGFLTSLERRIAEQDERLSALRAALSGLQAEFEALQHENRSIDAQLAEMRSTWCIRLVERWRRTRNKAPHGDRGGTAGGPRPDKAIDSPGE
jgi:predicted SAM-dependent methyltransferase/uncharacterized coiled-coil protein SlyX